MEIRPPNFWIRAKILVVDGHLKRIQDTRFWPRLEEVPVSKDCECTRYALVLSSSKVVGNNEQYHFSVVLWRFLGSCGSLATLNIGDSFAVEH